MGSAQEVVWVDDGAVRVLVVEDQRATAHALASFLHRRHGWLVDVAHDGGEALHLFRAGTYSAVMLKLGLPGPGPDGLELWRLLRAESKTVALIIVTGRDALEDELRAFATRADDYLAKSIEPQLLRAGAKAVVRRSSPPPAASGMRQAVSPHAPADRFLDRDSGKVRGPGGDAQLTRLELRLLIHCESSGSIALTAEAIAVGVLDRRDYAAKNLVHRHVANIRSKLRRVGLEDFIVRGPLGYVIRKR